METLERLRQRIDAAEDLRSVVATMKALAAASIHRFERAATAVGDADETILLGFRALLGDVRLAGGDVGTEPPRDRSPTVIAVAFGSDQGLCGPLDERVAVRTAELLGRFAGAPRAAVAIVIGSRLASRLERIGHSPRVVLRTPSSLDGASDAVFRLALEIDRLRRELEPSEVHLLAAHRRLGTALAVRAVRVLPLDRRWLATLGHREWPSRRRPIWPGERRVVLEALVSEYLFVTLFRAQVDSVAAEHASRLASMQAAEQNIDRRLGELRAAWSRERQARITAQLLDVVAGYETVVAEAERVPGSRAGRPKRSGGGR
jgi:F-type H+-transporting ATPase subunit gamma